MLKEKTRAYIEAHHLICPGDSVFVGLSRGADSVCLLLLLKGLETQLQCSVEAVHVNHNLRGEESDEDQLFTEALCRDLAVPLHCFSYPVEQMARELQLGIEEAGRTARQMAFDCCVKEKGADRIALAHHRRDQAETVLFRLARGTSVAGLGGIRPQSGPVIHPILFADKKEILAELERRGQTWRTDSSNLSDHYTRNCIRQQVFPVLEERVNPASVAHICEAAEDLYEVELLLDELAEPVRERCVKAGKEGELKILPELLRAQPILQRRVLLDALARLGESRKDLGRKQIAQLLDLLAKETGRRYSLPGRIEAVRTYEGLVLRKKKDLLPEGTKDSGASECRDAVRITGPGVYRFGRWTFTCVLTEEIPSEIPEKTYTKWMDYATIKDSLEIRNRRAGDVLMTSREGGRKKLKSYLIDEKIPAEERAGLPLLASGNRIFWVIGHRISEDCKITAQTKQCIRIEVMEEKT